MKAGIGAIEYHLPEGKVTNEALASEFPEWGVDKIEGKTGIVERRVAAEGECSSDLGATAAQKLFSAGACKPSDVDYLLFCTQSPDYFLPSSACILQDRLGIPTSAGALDFNLGCSGYVYGLGMAKALIESGQATNVLLITAETYSKFLHPSDKTVRTIFGDAGAATLVRALPGDSSEPCIGPFVYGTDGTGANNLIVRAGGMRCRTANGCAAFESEGRPYGHEYLYMNGPEIFAFTLRSVPDAVQRLLDRSGRKLDGIDLFIFHQANQYMLEHLRRKIHIPTERFLINLRNCGNTVSCSIPIALKQAVDDNRIGPGDTAMLVGFGVGYSWGAALIQWV